MRFFKLADILAKVLLLILFLHVLLNSELPQYNMQGMTWRYIIYPFAAISVYLVVMSLRIRTNKQISYPYDVDFLITFFVLLEMIGNTLNFYNTIEWWDDFMHLFNSIPWVLIFGLIICRLRSFGPKTVAALMIGYGAFTHILWEIAEYVTYLQQPLRDMDSMSAYRDTIGDLTMGLIGTMIGVYLMTVVFWRYLLRQKLSKNT